MAGELKLDNLRSLQTFYDSTKTMYLHSQQNCFEEQFLGR